MMLNSIEQIKGTNIILLNLIDIDNIIFDYIVICSVNSTVQAYSILSIIKEKIYNIIGKKPINIEGAIKSQWILMDYNNILLNIFQKPIRKFYDIETLWIKRLLKL